MIEVEAIWMLAIILYGCSYGSYETCIIPPYRPLPMPTANHMNARRALS